MAPTAVSTSKSMFLILQNVLLSDLEPLKHNNADLNMENETSHFLIAISSANLL
jgi:hypothetical protein